MNKKIFFLLVAFTNSFFVTVKSFSQLMTYSSSTCAHGNTSNVVPGCSEYEMLRIEVVTTGTLLPITLTGFTLSTNGSSSPAADISNSKVWYTGTSSAFAATAQFGSTAPAPNGTYTVSGSQALSAGTNYFWLTYNLTVSPSIGNLLDAECTVVTIGTTNYTPSVTAPAGNRTISNLSFQNIYYAAGNCIDTAVDYQIKLALTASNFNFSQAKPDGSDIRFFSSVTTNPYTSLTNKLSYWIESWNSTTQLATVWIKYPFVIPGNNPIYMYSGNACAANESNGVNVFVFFDDFNDNTWDPSKWTITQNTTNNGQIPGTANEAGGKMELWHREVGNSITIQGTAFPVALTNNECVEMNYRTWTRLDDASNCRVPDDYATLYDIPNTKYAEVSYHAWTGPTYLRTNLGQTLLGNTATQMMWIIADGTVGLNTANYWGQWKEVMKDGGGALNTFSTTIASPNFSSTSNLAVRFRMSQGGSTPACLQGVAFDDVRVRKCGCVTSVTGASLPFAVMSQTDIVCNGQCTGSASASVSGGLSPYTYLWSNGQSASSINNLCAGSYSLLVTDANGTTNVNSVTINQPAAVTVSAVGTSPACSGNTGSATVSASGGTPGYSYSWSNGQSSSAITGLPPGNYTVTVTDNNGCALTATVQITVPAAITASISSTQVSCGNNDGTAIANPSGGTGAYTYSWNTSSAQNTQTATGLAPGNYSVTITDVNGCNATFSVTVSSISGMTATVNGTNALCNGGTGSAISNPSGGNAPYTYLWSNSQANQTATGLTAGNYSVVVSDAGGCTFSATVAITEPAAITSAISSTQATCGESNGSATVNNISGGTSPYTYAWNNGQNASTATNLAGGNYSVLISDANGCTQTQTVTVADAGSPVAAVSPSNILCNGQCTGSASATVAGGTAPYTYSWVNTSQTGPSATSLCAGNYTVIVMDANGCTNSQTVSVSEPAAMNISASAVSTSCGLNNGSATADVSGGTSPYMYLWNNGGTAFQISNLTAQIYSVTVTDANGCTSVQTVSVAASTGATVSAGNDITIIIGGSAMLSASGGATFLWNNGAGSGATIYVEPTVTTEYCVTATDANGCIGNACVKVFVDIVCGTVFVPNAFSPNEDSQNDVECVIGNCVSAMTFTIYNRWGEKVFETNDPDECWDGKYHGSLQNAGVYTYILEAKLINGEAVNKQGNISLIR